MIFRKSKKKWTATPVAAAEDRSLSLEARGLLWYLLVKPDDWEVRTEDLLRSGFVGSPSSTDSRSNRLMGEKVLRRLIGELEAAGYVRRTVENTRDGAQWITEIFDTPLPKSERIIHKGRTRRKADSEPKEAKEDSPSAPEGDLGSDSPSAPSPSFPEGHLGINSINYNHEDYTHNYSFFSGDRVENPSGAGAPEKKKPVCDENLSFFALPDVSAIPDIIETGANWLEKHCPLVAPQRATAEFLAYHEIEDTKFKTQAHFLKAWRGWMRKAQEIAIERAERRGSRYEQTRTPDRESTNLRNLKATVEYFGIPDPQPQSGAELVRAYGAALAKRQRAASDELIRKSSDRYRAGWDTQ